MAEAYEKLGMPQLADDAKRVLAMNEKAGNFVILPEQKRSLLGKAWNAVGLDRN
jgi:outer membrane protein assembly factor BamD (BamD/ComL family)